MRYTNKYGLPEVLVEAIKYNEYSMGDADISATRMIQPPQAAYLIRKHYKDIETDVSEELWSLYGKAVHKVLEDTAQRMGQHVIAEQELVAFCNNWKIAGHIDLMTEVSPGVYDLDDWKTRKAWGVIKGKVADEEQLNIYGWLARKSGYEINRLRIHAFIKDWNKHEAARNPDYPQMDFHTTEISVWNFEEQEEFVQERIALHQMADFHAFECTDEERWMRDEGFAIWKNENKRATAVLPTQDEAEQRIEELKARDKKENAYVIEHRKSEPIRCLSYCKAAPFCPQHQEYLQHQAIMEEQSNEQ